MIRSPNSARVVVEVVDEEEIAGTVVEAGKTIVSASTKCASTMRSSRDITTLFLAYPMKKERNFGEL
jgi:hypothetical protein